MAADRELDLSVVAHRTNRGPNLLSRVKIEPYGLGSVLQSKRRGRADVRRIELQKHCARPKLPEAQRREYHLLARWSKCRPRKVLDDQTLSRGNSGDQRLNVRSGEPVPDQSTKRLKLGRVGIAYDDRSGYGHGVRTVVHDERHDRLEGLCQRRPRVGEGQYDKEETQTNSDTKVPSHAALLSRLGARAVRKETGEVGAPRRAPVAERDPLFYASALSSATVVFGDVPSAVEIQRRLGAFVWAGL